MAGGVTAEAYRAILCAGVGIAAGIRRRDAIILFDDEIELAAGCEDCIAESIGRARMGRHCVRSAREYYR
jgi:hypothetical protein